MEVFPSQMLNPESSITGTVALEDSERLLLHSVDSINAKKYSNLCITPPGYPQFQLFRSDVVLFVFYIHKNYSISHFVSSY